MLLELFRWLSIDIPAFNVFNYISLRAVLAVITSLLISFCFGGWFIKKLGEFSLGQYIRNDGPEGHLIKSGTPTMGGGLILISIIISTILWADLGNSYVWLLLFYVWAGDAFPPLCIRVLRIRMFLLHFSIFLLSRRLRLLIS